MGTLVTDPATGVQKWQGDQYQVTPSHMDSQSIGDGSVPVWVPESRNLIDTQAAYPGGGTKYDYGAGQIINTYNDPSTGGFYQKLADGNWYYHTPGGHFEMGWVLLHTEPGDLRS